MSKSEVIRHLNALSGYLSREHGDHEGGYAGNCAFCRLVSLVEIMAGVVFDIDPDEWEDG